MWVFLNDAFFSIVQKDCRRDELLVRARRKVDIEKLFPDAVVRRRNDTDYPFRAVISINSVVIALAQEVRRVTYPNFKDSVADEALHAAYERCWVAMLDLNPEDHKGPFTVRYRAGVASVAGISTKTEIVPPAQGALFSWSRKRKRRKGAKR